MAHPDLTFHSNGRNNESGVSLNHLSPLNGGRWGYDTVYEGPYTQPNQKGSIRVKGGDTLHFHLNDGVADASTDDLVLLYKRIVDHGDDNTMSVTDNHGNIAVFGLPDTLRKRGFSADEFMPVNKERDLKNAINSPAYRPFMKVLVPNR